MLIKNLTDISIKPKNKESFNISVNEIFEHYNKYVNYEKSQLILLVEDHVYENYFNGTVDIEVKLSFKEETTESYLNI